MKKQKITFQTILNGLNSGIIRIVDEGVILGGKPSNSIVCAIGDSWFYAFGQEGENTTPEEYRKNVPLRDIAEEIYAVLCGLGGLETELPDEYMYYALYLKEHNC
jgi:hypothetical protein